MAGISRGPRAQDGAGALAPPARAAKAPGPGALPLWVVGHRLIRAAALLLGVLPLLRCATTTSINEDTCQRFQTGTVSVCAPPLLRGQTYRGDWKPTLEPAARRVIFTFDAPVPHGFAALMTSLSTSPNGRAYGNEQIIVEEVPLNDVTCQWQRGKRLQGNALCFEAVAKTRTKLGDPGAVSSRWKSRTIAGREFRTLHVETLEPQGEPESLLEWALVDHLLLGLDTWPQQPGNLVQEDVYIWWPEPGSGAGSPTSLWVVTVHGTWKRKDSYVVGDLADGPVGVMGIHSDVLDAFLATLQPSPRLVAPSQAATPR